MPPNFFAPDPFTELLLDDDPDVDGTTLTVTRSGGLISNLSWYDNVLSRVVKTVAITRSGSLTATITTTAYLQDGTTIGSQKVETINRTSGVVSSIATTRPT